MKLVKIGVIGVGHMGSYHTNLLVNLPKVQLVGIADIIPERVERFVNRYKIQGFTDYSKLIKKVDAVVIAVPTSLHYQIAKDCILSNKHVLIEKPITNNIEQAEELIALAKNKKTILQVGHVERFNAAIQILKNIIINPHYIEAKRLGPYDGRVNDIGVVMDLMIHDVDIVLNLIGSEPTQIYSSGASVFSNFEDIAIAQIQFKNNCIASITGSRASQQKIRTLSISQRDSFVFLDYATQDLLISRRAASAYLLTPEEIKYTQEAFVEHVYVHKDNPLKLELSHFVDCILRDSKPYIELESELKALKISLLIESQIRKELKPIE